MQAIRTVYRGPTDTRGSRVVAKSAGLRTVMPYDYELSSDDNHRRAAELHVTAMFPNAATPAAFVTGTLPDGTRAHIITEVL